MSVNPILPGLEIESVSTDEPAGTITIKAKPTGRPALCPHCSSRKLPYRHVVKYRVVQDLPVGGKPLIWSVASFRYRCPACGKTFSPAPDGLIPGRRMTRRLHAAVAVQGMFTGPRETARLFRIPPTTTHRIFMEGSPPLMTVGGVLRLEKIQLGKRPFCAIFTEPHSLLLGAVPYMDRQAFLRFIGALSGKVEALVIGLDSDLRELLRDTLPEMVVALDKRSFLDIVKRCMVDTLAYYRGRIPPAGQRRFAQIEEQILNCGGLNQPAMDLARLWHRIRKYPRLKSAFCFQESAKRFFTQEHTDPVEGLKLLLWSAPIGLPGFKEIPEVGFSWHVEIINYIKYVPKLLGNHELSSRFAPASSFCDDDTFRRLLELGPPR